MFLECFDTVGWAGLGFVSLSPFHFICVYVLVFCVILHMCFILYHCGVDLMGLKPNPLNPVFLQCFDTVGWVI